MNALPVSSTQPLDAAGPYRRRRRPCRAAPAPRPVIAGAALLAAGAGLGATTALTITAETTGQLYAPGGLATFGGNVTGMEGTYLALMMVLLVSRIPVIEHVLGQDGLSVICRGRRLDRLPVSGGQFLLWRFLTRGPWWQAHPYTLSALPRPPYLRLTVKAVGDHSAALARLEPGTRVAIEGPYGIFTRHSRRRPRVLLIAAGIGVTSVRALLEDLPKGSRPVVVLRATRREDLVLGTEIADLVKRRGGQLLELTGDRMQAAIDQYSLRHDVPDLRQRDVYVCGPEGFVTEIVELLRWLGVPDEAIHHEAYAL